MEDKQVADRDAGEHQNSPNEQATDKADIGFTQKSKFGQGTGSGVKNAVPIANQRSEEQKSVSPISP